MSRAEPGQPLTEQEQEVLEWLARGSTYARTGRMTGLSESGAKCAADRVVVKLAAQNLVHAVHQAHCLGLLEHPYSGRKRTAYERKKTKMKGDDGVRARDGGGGKGL